MSDSPSHPHALEENHSQDVVISEQALQKAEEFIEAEEGASNKLKGWLGVLVTTLAVVMSVFHLYTAYAIVPTQTLRPRSEEHTSELQSH